MEAELGELSEDGLVTFVLPCLTVAKTFVKAACCVYPALALMNMYLWTVLR